MDQAHLFISGEVQGVGFRYFVLSTAEKSGLTGWVRNLPDGRVEAVVQGEKKKILLLIKQCHIGPMLSRVERIEVGWEERKEVFKEFTVK